MRTGVAVLLVAVLSGACATGYHSTGATGGFEEIQLGPATYQIRFSANGYTTQNRAADFLMRRCAELTLEHSKRYFSLGSTQSDAQHSLGWSFPHQEAIITLLEESTTAALDAVLIVQQTAERANGKLSPAALKTLQAMGEKPWGTKPAK